MNTVENFLDYLLIVLVVTILFVIIFGDLHD